MPHIRAHWLHYGCGYSKSFWLVTKQENKKTVLLSHSRIFLRYRFSCGWIFLSYFWTSANFRRNFDANNLKMTYLSLILEKNNSSLDSRLLSWGVIFDLFFSVRFFPFEAQWRESERENRPRSGPWQTSLATGAGGPIRSRETN